jgi:signal transduction histidine kinase
MVRGIYEDHGGKIWIGTDGGYANILDPKSMTITPLKVALPGDSFNFVPMHFLELDHRRMLVGTSLGLLQYDRVNKKFSPFAPLWSFSRGRTVRQLLRHNNFLYFIHNGGLYQFDLVTHHLQSFREAGDPEAVNLTAVYLDSEERVWVGSSKGVSWFDEKENVFHLIAFKDLNGSTQAVLLTILSIQQAGNDLYVGTFNGGFWRLPLSDLEHAAPKSYLEKDGLPSNTIYAALPDNSGKLWLSTNNGLARFDPSSGAVISFSISEGLQEEEFNRLAYTKTRNGMMVFGGINGINIFDPEEVKVSREEFVPAILSVSAFNPLHSGPTKETLYEHPEKLKLNYNNNFIRIDFFVPSYKFPKRYSVLYKLDQFENQWKEVFNENSATYSNLQPGEYTFLLKTRGINNEEHVIRLPIRIAPPYWKTWWFMLLSFCSVGLMVITIILSYIRKARRDRHRLEELLTIRTSEIEKSKEELQILNQKKDLIFSILSHDLRSPLTTLKGFLGYLIDHAHELTLNELKRHAINIKNSVTNSLDLIDNTLFWSLSQMGNIQYTPSTFALRDLVEKLHGLYQLTADKKRIPLSVSCPENILIHGDENMIYVALRNLVSNALKFTSEGNPVTITCRCNEGFAEVKVTDKGIGMSQEYVKRVLSTDQPMLKKGTSNEKGTGLGLLLCKKFIELNKGALYVTSIEHIGTTFTVILPLAVRKPTPATV